MEPTREQEKAIIGDKINALIPTQYKVIRVSFQVTDQGLRAFWDVQILNSAGVQLRTIHPTSQPDMPLRDALIDWHMDSTLAFEAATELTQWVDEEEGE